MSIRSFRPLQWTFTSLRHSHRSALDSRRTMCNSCRSTVLPPYRPARLMWRVPPQLGRREYAARLRDQHFCSNRGYFEHLRRIDRIWRSKVPLIQRRDENREQPARAPYESQRFRLRIPVVNEKPPSFRGLFRVRGGTSAAHLPDRKAKAGLSSANGRCCRRAERVS